MVTHTRCRSCDKKVDTKTLRLAEDKYICQSCFNGLFKESFIPKTLRKTFTPKESKTQGREPFSSSALYGSLKVKEQTPNYLLLARSRRKLIENIVVRFIVVILWSLMLFSFPDNQDALIKLVNSNAALASKDILSAVIFLLFMIVPVLVIVDSFRVFKTIAAGQKYEFKKDCLSVFVNNKKTLDFTDIECVNIRVIYDNDGADVYRLSLSLKRGGRFFIESSTDGNEVFEISEAVADIIKTEVKMA